MSSTATYVLTAEELSTAVELLSPAEAAKHVEHPNLWSWRELAQTSRPGSTFVALYVRDLDDDTVDDWDIEFRAVVAGGSSGA